MGCLDQAERCRSSMPISKPYNLYSWTSANSLRKKVIQLMRAPGCIPRHYILVVSTPIITMCLEGLSILPSRV